MSGVSLTCTRTFVKLAAPATEDKTDVMALILIILGITSASWFMYRNTRRKFTVNAVGLSFWEFFREVVRPDLWPPRRFSPSERRYLDKVFHQNLTIAAVHGLLLLTVLRLFVH